MSVNRQESKGADFPFALVYTQQVNFSTGNRNFVVRWSLGTSVCKTIRRGIHEY